MKSGMLAADALYPVLTKNGEAGTIAGRFLHLFAYWHRFGILRLRMPIFVMMGFAPVRMTKMFGLTGISTEISCFPAYCLYSLCSCLNSSVFVCAFTKVRVRSWWRPPKPTWAWRWRSTRLVRSCTVAVVSQFCALWWSRLWSIGCE